MVRTYAEFDQTLGTGCAEDTQGYVRKGKINEDRLKKAIGLTAAVAMLVPLAACGASGTEDITLSVWAPQEDQA